MKLTAKEYWVKKFGEVKINHEYKLSIRMMEEFANYMLGDEDSPEKSAEPIQEPQKPDRFFIFFYNFTLSSVNFGTGFGNMLICSNVFPSRNSITIKAKNDITKLYPHIAESDINVAIQNFIELTEEDFNNFYS